MKFYSKLFQLKFCKQHVSSCCVRKIMSEQIVRLLQIKLNFSILTYKEFIMHKKAFALYFVCLCENKSCNVIL
jgi:hypothetical protein